MPWSQLRNSDAPWGDYGRMLISGMTAGRDELGRLRVERVGPFVPPVTIAGISDLLVTMEFRALMEQSGISGLSFAEVIKARVVKLDWRSWDLGAPQPVRYPAGNEPENYVWGRKHNQDLADALPPIFEVVIDGTIDNPVDAGIVRTAAVVWSRILVSEAAARWFAVHASDWLKTEPEP